MLRFISICITLFFLSSSKKKGGMEVNVNHFEGLAHRTLGLLSKLKRFIIKNFHGSRAQMLFVRFTYASAPLLLGAVLYEDAEGVHRSKILKELLGYPRPSPKLLIYS